MSFRAFRAFRDPSPPLVRPTLPLRLGEGLQTEPCPALAGHRVTPRSRRIIIRRPA